MSGQTQEADTKYVNCDCLLVADGKLGNEEGAPYDAIHVGAAAAGRDPYPTRITLSKYYEVTC